MMSDGSSLVQSAREGRVRSAVAVEKTYERAHKHLAAAVGVLARGDFQWGLSQAMALLVMLDPRGARSRRDELLLAAVEAGVPRAEVMRAAGIKDGRALRSALSRGRKRKSTA